MGFNMKVTPEIEELTNICLDNSKMDVSLYGQYDVKRGLRDINGVGVLAGLTQISNVVSSDIIDGVKTPCDGRLYYRGINVEKLTQGLFLAPTSVTIVGSEERKLGEVYFRCQTVGDVHHLLSAGEPVSYYGAFNDPFQF